MQSFRVCRGTNADRLRKLLKLVQTFAVQILQQSCARSAPADTVQRELPGHGAKRAASAAWRFLENLPPSRHPVGVFHNCLMDGQMVKMPGNAMFAPNVSLAVLAILMFCDAQVREICSHAVNVTVAKQSFHRQQLRRNATCGLEGSNQGCVCCVGQRKKLPLQCSRPLFCELLCTHTPQTTNSTAHLSLEHKSLGVITVADLEKGTG